MRASFPIRRSEHRRLPLLAASAAAALLAGCGAKSGLWSVRDDAPPITTLDGSFLGDAGQLDAPASGDASADAAMPDASPDAQAWLCGLAPSAEPREVLSDVGSDFHTPSMVVLNAGSDSEPATIALQAVGGDPLGIQLIFLRLDASWPAGLSVDKGPLLVGSSMTYAQMTHVPGDAQKVSLAWGDGNTGAVFRTVDIPSWSVGPLVTVGAGGGTPTGLVAGEGIPDPNGATFAGEGYGMVWSEIVGGDPMLRHAVVAVLDSAGNRQVGPIGVSEAIPSGTEESAIAWSGLTYLLATRFVDCLDGDPLCVPHSIAVSRLWPPHGGESARLEVVNSFQPANAAHTPGYPTVAEHGGRVFAAWDDGLPGTTGAARTVRFAELTSAGASTKSGIVTDAAFPLQRVWLATTDAGPIVGWAEDGDSSLPDDAWGRSLLVVDSSKSTLAPSSEPIRIGTTRYSSAGWPTAVPLANPRGLLVTWAARSRQSDRNAIYVTFLPCE